MLASRAVIPGLRSPVPEATDHRSQQEASLSAVEDRDETLVDRRIGDEQAYGSLALVDLLADRLEIGDGGSQVLQGECELALVPGIGHQATERAAAAGQAVGDLAEVVRDRTEVLEDRSVLRVEEEARQQSLLALRLLDHGADPIHRGHEALRGGGPLGREEDRSEERR